MFCVVRAVHKFDFRLVINETPNKWRLLTGRSCSDNHFLTRSVGFPPAVVGSVKGLDPRCQGQVNSLGQYVRRGPRACCEPWWGVDKPHDGLGDVSERDHTLNIPVFCDVTLRLTSETLVTVLTRRHQPNYWSLQQSSCYKFTAVAFLYIFLLAFFHCRRSHLYSLINGRMPCLESWGSIHFHVSSGLLPFWSSVELRWTALSAVPHPMSSSTRHAVLLCFIFILRKLLLSGGCFLKSED
jgi:hypothetical protein